MSATSRREVLKQARLRYGGRGKAGRSRLLDEICVLCGYERKYASKLLGGRRPIAGESVGSVGQSLLLTLVMRERVPVNCRRISQTFSPAGLASPFVARAMPTRSSDKRLRKYANLSSQRSSRRLIRNGAFQGCRWPVRLGLTLRRGTDNNLAHVNIG